MGIHAHGLPDTDEEVRRELVLAEAPEPERARAPRIRLYDLALDAVTEVAAIATILRGLAEGRGGWVVTPNLDQLRRHTKRPELAPIFERADLVLADGMPLVWASRLQGTPLPERVPGSELVWSLTAEAALRGRSIYLLGGAEGACAGAERQLLSTYSGLAIAGCYSPPVGFEHDPSEIAEIRTRLRTVDPDIVYVALGFPKQERLIAYLRTEFPSAWFVGVGFSLSFLADDSTRAPDWLSRLGLEWAHRLVREPRRLAKRYLIDGIPFAARLFARSLWRRLARREEFDHGAHPPDPATGPERVVFVSGSLERERARLLAELLESD